MDGDLSSVLICHTVLSDRLTSPRQGDLEPVDVDLSSVLSTPLELTPEFKANYRRWLEREVFQQATDWDKLIEPGYMG